MLVTEEQAKVMPCAIWTLYAALHKYCDDIPKCCTPGNCMYWRWHEDRWRFYMDEYVYKTKWDRFLCRNGQIPEKPSHVPDGYVWSDSPISVCRGWEASPEYKEKNKLGYCGLAGRAE